LGARKIVIGAFSETIFVPSTIPVNTSPNPITAFGEQPPGPCSSSTGTVQVASPSPLSPSPRLAG
jgi:hypothetical protein